MAATTDPVVKVGPAIWIAKLRTGRGAIFRASASKTSNAAAVVVSVGTVSAVGDLAVIALGEAVLGEAALADLEVAAGADGNDLRS